MIDFCLMKQLKNEMRSNYSMLIMSWASKSNCKQRAGRVGRVADGRVYRLIHSLKFSVITLLLLLLFLFYILYFILMIYNL